MIKLCRKEFQLTLQGSEKTKKNQYQQSSYNFYRVNKLLDTRLYVSIKMYLNIQQKKMVIGINQTPTVMAVAVMTRVVFLTHRLNKKIKSKHQISHAKDFV